VIPSSGQALRGGVVVSFADFMEWSRLQELLGEHGKLITTVIALLIAVVTLAAYVFRYWHAQLTQKEREDAKEELRVAQKKLDEQQADLDRKNKVLQHAADAIKQQQTDLAAKEVAIAEREQKLRDVRNAFRGKEHDLWCLHPARPPENYTRRISEFQRNKQVILVANLKGASARAL
jgi:hypothetical protein